MALKVTLKGHFLSCIRQNIPSDLAFFYQKDTFSVELTCIAQLIGSGSE